MQAEISIQESLFGKTSPEHSPATEAQTSNLSSTKWATAGHWNKNGLSWMHNTSESPNDDGVYSSSLVSILQQPQDVPNRYFLSRKAVTAMIERETLRCSIRPTASKTNTNSESLPQPKQSPLSALLGLHFPPEN